MLPSRPTLSSLPYLPLPPVAIPWGADRYALRAHMNHCRTARSPWLSLRCAAGDVGSFLAPRSFTTLVVAAIVARVITLAL